MSHRESNPLSKQDRTPFGSLRVVRISDQKEVISVRINPIISDNDMAYREEDVQISWSDDSGKVVFITPEGKTELNVAKYTDR